METYSDLDSGTGTWGAYPPQAAPGGVIVQLGGAQFITMSLISEYNTVKLWKMAQAQEEAQWQTEASHVVAAMAHAGLALAGVGPLGPSDSPHEAWLGLVARVAQTYAAYKQDAWTVVKDILTEPEPSLLLDYLFDDASYRARRLEYLLTVQYPLHITRRTFDERELELLGF